jgi:hypothetical protein
MFEKQIPPCAGYMTKVDSFVSVGPFPNPFLTFILYNQMHPFDILSLLTLPLFTYSSLISPLAISSSLKGNKPQSKRKNSKKNSEQKIIRHRRMV